MRIVVKLLIMISPLSFMTGCAQYTLCYEHPSYGKLCVSIDGKDFVKKDMSDAEKAALVDADKRKAAEEHK